MRTHSPEPWVIKKQEDRDERTVRTIFSANGDSLMCNESYYPAVPYDEDDWERIVACVNACAGIETEDLIDKCDRCGWAVGLHGITCDLIYTKPEEDD